MRIVLTGSSGFIGSALVDELMKNTDHELYCIDPVYKARYHYVRNPRYTFSHVKAQAYNAIPFLTKNDLIIHLGATTSVHLSVKNPDETLENNHDSFLAVLKAARNTGCKLIYASSSSVYGLKSPYAISKATNELYAKTYFENFGTRVFGFRFFNVFGENQPPRTVIPIWLDSIKKSKQVIVYGDGSITRDFTHISNVIHAIRLAIECETAYNRCLDIACGESYSLNDVISIMHEYRDFEVIHLEKRKADIEYSQAVLDSARYYLGYEPITKFKEALGGICKRELRDIRSESTV